MSQFISQTSNYRCALALMATVPGLGLADPKAGPVPPLTRAEATELKHNFLRDLSIKIGRVVDAHRADGVVVFAPAHAESQLRQLVSKDFKLFPQRGQTLGEIFSNASEDLLGKGFPSVCLINCDSPTLPVSLLEVAIEFLSSPGDRMSLGAVDNGGYYLIGLKSAHRDLFARISSNASNVVAHTRARAAEIGLKIEMMPPWYEVNDATTLDRLCFELLGPNAAPTSQEPFTRRFLDKLIQTEGPGRISPSLTRRLK